MVVSQLTSTPFAYFASPAQHAGFLEHDADRHMMKCRAQQGSGPGPSDSSPMQITQG